MPEEGEKHMSEPANDTAESSMESSAPVSRRMPNAGGKANSLGIPIAIVIAAALIAGAIYFSGQRPIGPAATGPNASTTQQTPEQNVKPVTSADHIRGNPNAPILLVEYSDYDCPFCRLFHDTMSKIMDTYGQDGSVAWVYRQFPLQQLHPNAPKLAEASECVADQGGNDAFWKFTDALNGSRKITYAADGTTVQAIEPTDMTKLDDFAKAAGVDVSKFELCLNSSKFADKIKQDVTDAIAAGGRGTPYTAVMVGGKVIGTIPGALPYDTVKQNIDTILAQIKAQQGGAATSQ